MTKEEYITKIEAQGQDLLEELDALIASGASDMDKEAVVDLFNSLGDVLERLRNRHT
jgi:hypothetical protein